MLFLKPQLVAVFSAAVILTASAHAANCAQTSVGFIPLTDLGAARYLNQYQGGLYPNGSNVIPSDHAALGTAASNNIVPLNTAGFPAPNGKFVLLSIGMSNTSQEFSQFLFKTIGNPAVNSDSLAIINGAQGGKAAAAWLDPNADTYRTIRDTNLTPNGLSERQVQAVWLKLANAGPQGRLPNANADAFLLEEELGDIVRTLKIRYPNLRMIFLSSRVYAGYATSPLNPEPYAYEAGFSVKWLIEAQIRQSRGQGIDPRAGDLSIANGTPWLAWGPYLWADGLRPRSDGLTWRCSDFMADGTHPSPQAREKFAEILLDYFLESPFSAPWFATGGTSCPPNGDVDGDGTVTPQDSVLAFGYFVGANDLDPCSQARADIDGVPGIGVEDALLIYELTLEGQ